MVKANRVVTLKADKTGNAPEVDHLLMELGNSNKAIPFLAIYPADGSRPITLEGPITPWQVFSALSKAGASKRNINENTVMR